MNDSDQESTCNTEDLMSGIYRLDDISPLQSPRAAVLSELTEHTQIYSLSKQTRPQQVMSEVCLQLSKICMKLDRSFSNMV